MTSRKKLIEVALPLEAVNRASAREKSIRHGHPSTLHLWWARRPLAAARAVIFAQMVDDPSAWPDLFPTVRDQERERRCLFKIMEDLVLWENTTNEEVLRRAREEIWKSWRRTCAANADHPRGAEIFDPHRLPAFHDPFAGGGALPLEAQRLGLKSYASDLNPVAVLINKAMIEIPPRFAGRAPVNPQSRGREDLIGPAWQGAAGLAEDVRWYGQWMRDEAEKRIGHLYPQVEVTAGMVRERPDLKPYLGEKLTVIAWIWARTVKSPNPAFAHVDVPLASTFMLSTKKGKEAFVEVVKERNPEGDGGRSSRPYHFAVRVGKPRDPEGAKRGTKLARGGNFACVMSGTPMSGDYIKAEGRAGRMGSRLMAIVAEGERGRVYLSPNPDHEAMARQARPEWTSDVPMPDNPRWFSPPLYGFRTFADLFTPRQLVALTTFSDLVLEAREKVLEDAKKGWGGKDPGAADPGGKENPDSGSSSPDPEASLSDGRPLSRNGTGPAAYADAVAVYLAFALSKQADLGNSLCAWEPNAQCPRHLFARQAIPMVWDFAEGNPLGNSSGSWSVFIDGIVKAFAKSFEWVDNRAAGFSMQSDAATQSISEKKIISTDPPYYDNIGYADLSDFFYVWLRRSLRNVFTDLFSTLAVPKVEELVATPYRHGSKEEAETFFLDGMTAAMGQLARQAHPAFPVSIYYAFKQAEKESEGGTASTGWETFLGAVIEAGFSITGTWPIRTENESRMIGQGTNALASSVVLVCRKREAGAPTATRREFVEALKEELPPALRILQGLPPGNSSGGGPRPVPSGSGAFIAPVDLAQAAIGPGMGVYTRYARVIDASGREVPVREALALINQVLDEYLAEQEGDFDAHSRWALAWFEQFGFAEGEFGVAETLSKAKDTSVAGMAEAGLLVSGKGKVRLLRPGELDALWTPGADPRLSDWKVLHHLVRVLESGGEGAAAQLAGLLGPRAERARELCYRLYTLCERKKRAAEALSYNSLVRSWPEILRLAGQEKEAGPREGELFDEVH